MNLSSVPSILNILGVCSLTRLQGPLDTAFWGYRFQAIPINRLFCPPIEPNVDVIYYVYTRSQKVGHYITPNNDLLLKNSGIDFSRRTVFFFHGFLETSSMSPEQQFKDVYLEYEDSNFILVDAKRLLAGPSYSNAVMNVVAIGNYTAELLCYLKSKGLRFEDLHLIGMSLGAQIIATASENLKCGKLKRITGIEPAGPVYTMLSNEFKLDASDADFVDVYHTTAIFGYPKSIGHVDFWINNPFNPKQDGCLLRSIQQAEPIMIGTTLCSHRKSLLIYTDAVMMNSLYATKCTNLIDYKDGKCENNTKVIVSPKLDPSLRGDFFVETNAWMPFIRS